MMAADKLCARLERLVGASRVWTDAACIQRFAVDRYRPTAVVRPETIEQAVAILALAGQERWAVVPWGQGTQMHIGGVPWRYDLALSLADLCRVVSYDAANLTLVAEAGLPLRDVYRASIPEGQFLPLGFAGTSASLGGLLVTNTSGVKRARYGGVRDLLLGVRVALPDGSFVRFGGRVVKNVAGYDMNKLFIGSLGAFGVVLETCFRLSALPEDDQTLAVVFPSLDRAVAAARAVQASHVQPCAVFLLHGAAASSIGLPVSVTATQVVLLLNVDGLYEDVERQLRDSRTCCQPYDVQSEALITEDHLFALWEGLEGWRAAPTTTESTRLQIRLGVLPSCIEMALDYLQKRYHPFTPDVRWCADCVHGQIIAQLPFAPLEDNGIATGVRDWLTGLRQQARNWHGYCDVMYAPGGLRHALDMWDEPPGTALLRRYKQQFDPHVTLNPGRFVAGL